MPDLTVAQNIFIGREPRGSRIFLASAAQRAGRELSTAWAPARPAPWSAT